MPVLDEFPCRRVANRGPYKARKLDREGGEGFHLPEDVLFRREVERLFDAEVFTLRDVRMLNAQQKEYVNYHRKLFLHCCGVAVAAVLLARSRDESLEVQAQTLYAGFYHDLGKIRVPSKFLYEWEWLWRRYRKACRWIIKFHVWIGYGWLRFTKHRYAPICAHVALNHHAFQKHSYPSKHVYKILQEPSKNPQTVADRVLMYVAIADACLAILRDKSNERESRIEQLKQEMPEFAELIEVAFDGIIKRHNS